MGRILGIDRISSDPQKDSSGQENQKADIITNVRSMSMFKDYEIVFKSYVQSTSYTDYDERKDYTDILNSVEKGDVLAFSYTSRFSRNVDPAVQFMIRLKEDRKVNYVIIGTRAFDLSNVQDYTDLIKMMADENKATSIWLKICKDGKRTWNDKGYYAGGKKCYGYGFSRISVGKKLRTVFVIIEEEAVIVIFIFKEYLTGKSSTDIAIELNNRGVKSPEGTRWGSSSIQRILKRKKYLGVMGKDGSCIVPQIIDEETFNEAQRFRIKNRKRGKRAKTMLIVPLRNKLYCGCGSRILYRHFSSRGTWSAHRFCCYYHFLTKENKGVRKSCPTYLDAHELIDFVWGKILPILTEPDRLRKVLKEYFDSTFVKRVETNMAIDETQKALDKLNARIDRVKYLYEIGDLTAKEYSEKKRSSFEQKVILEEKIITLRNRILVDNNLNNSVEKIEQVLPLFRNELENSDWASKAFWLDLLIEKVVLTYTDKGCEVTIHGLVDDVLDGYVDYLRNKNNSNINHHSSLTELLHQRR